jgi:16S rRNA C967 or C1407 C5-methylase (RsmB/RsmF family)
MSGFPPKRSQSEPIPLGTISPLFLNYYRQILVPSSLTDEDFDQMISSFKTELPHVFRISPNVPRVSAELESFISSLDLSLTEITVFPSIFGRIYRLPFDKNTLRKMAPLEAFNSWLYQQTRTGNCHRQEFVSMIPPYFLDVEPTSVVLDMCAAPGSKTGQLLQMADKGLVIANEIDLRRCHDLVHQLQRIGTKRCIVTCQPAEAFDVGTLAFDRVLCDVPCSGDGTIRKDPRAGAEWNVKGGLQLHHKQRAILLRGLEVTAVGGVCVYSTCSMNPIENEAVINSVVNQLEGAVEIVDCADRFVTLERSPGISSWPVFGPELERIEEPDAGEWPTTLFPIGANESLRRCMRFYPHVLNSGGFFVAVLKKIRQLGKASKDPVVPAKEFREPPFKQLGAEADSEIRQTFGLLPEFRADQLFFRGEQKANGVYYFESSMAGRMLRVIPQARFRVVSGGVKVFNFKRIRKDQPELIVPCQEGIKVIIRYITRRKFALTPEEMKLLLESTGDGLPYAKLRKPLADAIHNGPWTGAVFGIDGTDFQYCGIACKATIKLFLRSDVIPWELKRLAKEYPFLGSE